jgi:hypothetical protein
LIARVLTRVVVRSAVTEPTCRTPFPSFLLLDRPLLLSGLSGAAVPARAVLSASTG